MPAALRSVTGGNAGLGFRSALELARHGARVIIACRSPEKGEAAAARIRAEAPAARLDAVALDLTEPGSIERCAGEIASRTERLDILLNNAGVVSLETPQHTATGHEMHMATNHYGHFALAGRLFGLLAATPGARVITVTSGGARRIAMDDKAKDDSLAERLWRVTEEITGVRYPVSRGG